MSQERDHLLPMPKAGFDLAEVSFPIVDSGGSLTVRTNRYSTPLRPGMPAQVKLYPAYVEIWHAGQQVGSMNVVTADDDRFLILNTT